MSDLAQALGISLVLGISASALYIAADQHRWASTGRVALAVLGTYQLVFAFSRLMRLYDYWNADTAFAFNTIMAGAFFAIFVNLIALNVLWKRHGILEPGGELRSEPTNV